MHPAIEFKTNMFDVSSEEENPINPIYGQSLLLWLRENAAGKIEVPEPDYEDWGWFSNVDWNGRFYMLGASSDDGETWILQMEKRRTFSEKLFGRERMGDDDEAWRLFTNMIEAEPEFKDISPA